MNQHPVFAQVRQRAPKVHCLTNPVTMQDVANVLLAAGGSAVMAQDAAEVEEITTLCDATLLNTGVPSAEKFHACALAGVRANELGHPVVLDPVGAGASAFRRSQLDALLEQVRPTVIRCNQEEAAALLGVRQKQDLRLVSGGVESSLSTSEKAACALATQLAQAVGCTVLMTGAADVVTDGVQLDTIRGGDPRIQRITGGGCMLSALCARSVPVVWPLLTRRGWLGSSGGTVPRGRDSVLERGEWAPSTGRCSMPFPRYFGKGRWKDEPTTAEIICRH